MRLVLLFANCLQNTSCHRDAGSIRTEHGRQEIVWRCDPRIESILSNQ